MSRHKLYPSQVYLATKTRRLRRIQKRATAELKEAYEGGRLSLRAYDRLSKLPPLRQSKAAQLDRHKEQAQNLAAVAIRSVLADKPQRIDLVLIARKIAESIRHSGF